MKYEKNKNLDESKLLLEGWKEDFLEDLWHWYYEVEQGDKDQALALYAMWLLWWEHLQWLRDEYKRLGCGGMDPGIWGETERCRQLREMIEKMEDNRPPTCINCPDFDDAFPDWPPPSLTPKAPEKKEPEITPKAPVKPHPPFGKPTDPFSHHTQDGGGGMG